MMIVTVVTLRIQGDQWTSTAETESENQEIVVLNAISSPKGVFVKVCDDTYFKCCLISSL